MRFRRFIFAMWAAVFSAAGGLLAGGPVVPGVADDSDPSLAGQVLLSELNCVACHNGDMPRKGAPDLSLVGARVHRAYLVEFMADPHAVKPGTTMPDVLGAMPQAERLRAAEAIADFLLTQGGEPPVNEPIDAKAVERGRESFHSAGCVACHSPEGKDLPGSPPLVRLESKYSLGSLTRFLEDPLAVRPGGRMPDLRLSHWEAVDLASFLLRDQANGGATAGPAAEPRIDEGRMLFQRFGCAACHSLPGTVASVPGGPLDALDPSKGCSVADYGLSQPQVAQIAGALHAGARPPDGPESRIRLEMMRLNCIACHRRDGTGGPTPERDPFFTTTNLNLGEQARIPPALDGVGAKLDPAWLRKVLVGGESARPYMTTRMPKFGAANVEKLLDLLGKSDSLEPVGFERVEDEKLAREAGHGLVGDKMLACVACHTFDGKSATTLEAVELTSMTARLRENWFHHYLRDPQRFHPGTIMPSFWPGGKSVRPEVLDGDAGRQIDAIWQYLSQGREARVPSGIRREPIVLAATDGEAVMLRRQYHGIGKRGIGVGYPNGINLAFDASQMRVGTIWKGEFGEMSGVWGGQGSGNVGERSREVVRFPVGPGLARLESPDSPWPEVEISRKAPGFQFLGYSLDAVRRPTFRYAFEGLGITDGFVDSPEGPSLVRTLRLDAPGPEGVFLRLAADEGLATDGVENRFAVGHGLTIAPSAKATLRAVNGVNELIIDLSGVESLTINYTFGVMP